MHRIFFFIIFSFVYSQEKGSSILDIDRFNNAIKEFSQAIEQGKSKYAIDHFLKMIKFAPNREIIQKVAELSGIQRLFPLAYHKEYEWTPVISPDGKKIVYLSWQKKKEVELHNSIHIMDIDGSNDKVLVSNEYDNINPVFSNDGKFILYESFRKDTNKDGRISKLDNRGYYIIDLKSKKEEMVISDDWNNYGAQISPNSRYIAFFSLRKDTNNDGNIDKQDGKGIYIKDLLKKEEIKISDESYYNSSFFFTPDSNFLIFTLRNEDTNNDKKIDEADNQKIYGYNLIEKKEFEIVNNKYDNQIVAISPDSKFIIYFVNKGRKEVHMINITTLEDRHILKKCKYDIDAIHFSPDGRRIAFTLYKNDTNKDKRIDAFDNRSIYILDLFDKNAEEIQIVDDKFDNSIISFYPDGKKILFSSWRKDTNGDGVINFLDISGMYIIDVVSSPTIKMQTIVNKNMKCSRIIEIAIDPLFMEMAKKQKEFLAENTWTVEYIQGEKYNIKLASEFINPENMIKKNRFMKWKRSSSIFKNIYEIHETFSKSKVYESYSFFKFVEDITRLTVQPIVLQVNISIPGKIKRTNGEIHENFVSWTISINDLMKSNKDLELYLESERTNWINIVFMIIIFVSSISYSGYVVYSKKKEEKEVKKLMNKELSEAHFYLANAYKNKGVYDKAIEEYKKVLSFDNNNALAYYNISICYSLMNDEKSANEYFEKAIKLNPELKNMKL